MNSEWSLGLEFSYPHTQSRAVSFMSLYLLDLKFLEIMRCFWVIHALFDLPSWLSKGIIWIIPGQCYQYAKLAIGIQTSLSFSASVYPLIKSKFLVSS